MISKKTLDCQFGNCYYKRKESKSTRLCLQGTRKRGCPAHINIYEYELFPEYQFSSADKHLSKKAENEQRKQMMNALKVALSIKEKISTSRKWFVSLPNNDAHEKSHPIGISSGAEVTQKVSPMIANKIEDFVKEGMTDPCEIRRALSAYVKSCAVDCAPQALDRAYFPTLDDIRNHVYRTKTALQLSKFDQQNLSLMIKEWQTTQPLTNHYFRPYKSGGENKQQCSVNDEGNSQDETNEFLWVHQEQWQKDLLIRYGNTICLMDAMYRTTKYDLPLFFICVTTNCNYMVVAEFIVASEGIDAIAEALRILQGWNPSWNPPYFITDYSDAGIDALEEVFCNTIVYICDFHREQAWTRWVHDRKHGLSRSDGDLLLQINVARLCMGTIRWTGRTRPALPGGCRNTLFIFDLGKQFCCPTLVEQQLAQHSQGTHILLPCSTMYFIKFVFSLIEVGTCFPGRELSCCL